MESEKAAKVPGLDQLEKLQFTANTNEFLTNLDNHFIIIRQLQGGNWLVDYIVKKLGWRLGFTLLSV